MSPNPGRADPAGGEPTKAQVPPQPAGSALPQLVRDVDDDDQIIARFVADYLSLLDHRMDTLRRLLAGQECPEAIRVSILSLETTSAMLGGTEVVSAARALRAAVAQQHWSSTEVLLDRLIGAAERLRQALAGQVTTPPTPRPADAPPAGSRPRERSPRTGER